MIFITHILFSALAGLFGLSVANHYYNFSLLQSLILFMIFMLASLIPDLDLPESKFGQKIKPVSWMINIIFGHRHLLHSVLFPFVISLLVYLAFGTVYASAFFLGFMSHIILDMLTPQGIEILYPFSKHRVQGFIRTGSFLEYVLIIAISALLIIFVITKI